MPANVMMPLLSMNGVQMNSNPAGSLSQGGLETQGNSPAGSFDDILKAVVAELGKSLGGQEGATIANADGKPVSLDELMQKLLASEDTKTGTGDTANDILQQLIAQLQMTGVVQPAPQPAMQLNLFQNGQEQEQGLTSGICSGALVSLLASAGRTDYATENMASARGTLNAPVSDLSPMERVAGTNESDLQSIAAPSVDKSGSGAPPAPDKATPSMTENAIVTAKGSGNAQNMDSATVLPVEGSPARAAGEGFAVFARKGTEAVPATDHAINNGVFPAEHYESRGIELMSASNGASGSQRVPSAHVEFVIQSGEAKSEVKTVAAKADMETGQDTSSKGTENVMGAAVQPHQAAYEKGSAEGPRETVHVSRLHELSEPIMKTVGAGEKQLIVKLDPPDLGSIQIKLKMEGGVLRADIKVDSASVKDLFSTALPGIKSSLESSGLRAGDFHVDVRDEHYSDGRGQQENAQQQQNRKQKEPREQFFDYFA